MVRTQARAHAGFGLVELMVTLVVLAVVLGSIYGTFFTSQEQTRHLSQVADQRQHARTAVQLIERETRMAGSGWGRLTVQGSRNGTPWSLTALNPGYSGDPGRSDSLTLIGAWQANTTISASMPNASSVLRVTNPSGFADGDLVIITNGVSAHLFQVTHVNSSSGILQHNPSSPYNVPGGHSGWPAGGYGVGSNVYKITMSTWRYDSTTHRRPALVRSENGGAPQVVAYGVDGFRVWYQLNSGAVTRNPADLSEIDKVIPVVATRVVHARRATLRDSAWAVVRPRTF